jgi:hypothetical protein
MIKVKSIVIAVLLVVVVLANALPAFAQQPAPPRPPQWRSVVQAVKLVLPSRNGVLLPGWAKYATAGGWRIVSGPFETASGGWACLVVKAASSTLPGVLMVPNPKVGGKTYCKSFPKAPECVKRKM